MRIDFLSDDWGKKSALGGWYPFSSVSPLVGDGFMSAKSMLFRLLRSIREEGPLGAARRVRYHCYEYYREWQLGIESRAPKDPYGPRGDHQRIPYEPLCYACIDSVLQCFSPNEKHVFLDYGCGRGRVTSVAATYPFRKVIGVELQPDLCAAARVNMQRVRGKRCQDWEIIETDATEFYLPPDVNFVFLFNPFVGEVLERVVQRIKESLVKHPRTFSLIYVNSRADPDVFQTCSWLNLKREIPVAIWNRTRLRHYEFTSLEGVELCFR